MQTLATGKQAAMVSRLRKTLLLVAAVACLAVLWLTRVPGSWQVVQLPHSDIQARLKPHGEAPWVVVLQGYFLPPHFVDDAALEFWRRGFSVATLDLNRAQRPRVPLAELVGRLPGPVGIYAHSGSVTPTVEVASGNADVAAVVLLGFHPGLRRDMPPPRNVMLAFGIFDDYITPAEMLQALKDTKGAVPAAPGEVAGDFADGSARKLVLSPFSQHGGEPYDPLLQEEAVAWLGEALHFRSSARPGLPLGMGSLALFWLGTVAGLALPRRLEVAAALALLTLVGVLHPAPGLTALAIFVLRFVPGAALHAVSLAVGLNSGLTAAWFGAERGGSFGEWLRVLGLYEVLYMPSQAAGWLSAWGESRAWPLWAAAAFWLGLLAVTRLAPERLEDWDRRWRRTCRHPVAWAVAAATVLLHPAIAVGMLAYLSSMAVAGGSPRCSKGESRS
ncbi:MAG: hypothetical protein AB1758_11850 [Candidatus Eremiobacterota bacterium]